MAEPIPGLLGDPTRCRKFTDDVTAHWFPDMTPGTVCHCGETARTVGGAWAYVSPRLNQPTEETT